MAKHRPTDATDGPNNTSAESEPSDPERAVDEQLLGQLDRTESTAATRESEQLAAAKKCLDLLDEYRQARSLDPSMIASAAASPWSFGRFRVIEELGRGGFGIVYRANDPELNREVALKLPRADCLWTPELRQRFLYEGQIAARLDHPNIVPVFQAGECDGVCYLVAAYMPGRNLAAWLAARTKPLACSAAARLVAALADAVEHAHSRGVLHRDLKPANVLIDPAEDVPRITDFGLARLADGEDGLTQTGLMLGTPAYMAPEQAAGDGRQIGTHTDIYALGVILYELLTRVRPLEGASRSATLRLILTGEVTAVRVRRADVPRDLESVCMRCLEKEPVRRYPTARELSADLRRYLEGEPVLARPPRLGRRVAAWCRRRPAMAGFVAATVAAVGLLAAGIAWHINEIEQVNDSLKAALDAEEEQRSLAVERERNVRDLAYAGQVRLASGLWVDGQTDSICEVLDQLRPLPQEADPRCFAWRFLWDQGLNDQRIRGHRGLILSLDFDTRGSLYTTATDGTIRIWDAKTGRPRGLIDVLGHREPHLIVASPDGSQIAVLLREGEDNFIQVWEVSSERLIGIYDTRVGLPCRFAFLHDNQTLAIRRHPSQEEEPGALLFWNARTGEQRLLLKDFYQGKSLAVSPNGRLVAAGCEFAEFGNESAVVLLTPAGELIGTLPTVEGLISDLGFSPDGSMLAGSTSLGEIRIWDLSSRTEHVRISVAAENERISEIAFTGDGRCVASRTASEIMPWSQVRFHDVRTGEEVSPGLESLTNLGSLKVDPTSDRVAVVSNYNHVRLFRPRPVPESVRIPAHQKEAWGVAFTPDGRTLVSSSDDHTAVVWDTRTWERRHVLQGHDSLVSALEISSDGTWVATGSYDGTVKVWDLASGEELRTLCQDSRPIRAIAVSPDGTRIASGDVHGSVWLWDVRTGRRLEAWDPAVRAKSRSLVFTPDGTRLIAGGDNRMVVVRDLVAGGKWEYAHSAQASSAVILPGGRELLTGGSDGVLQVRDLDSGLVRDLPSGHVGQVYGLAVSPDGRMVASAGEDQCVRLWHLATGLEVCVFRNLGEPVWDVAFSPDGTTLVAALNNGDLIRWSAPPAPSR